MLPLLTLAATLATLPLTSAQSLTPAPTTCTPTLHMIVARASLEKNGTTGIIGAVANDTQAQIPNSNIVPVIYPATLTEYKQSEASGVAEMKRLIMEYVDQCPNGQIALLGYSQGAMVIGDVLCGFSEAGFEEEWSDPLAAKYGDRIVAAVQMGDASYVPGQSYDEGTSQMPGVFNRTDPSSCDAYASKLASYCDTDDLYCAKGKSIQVHLSYVKNYGQQAQDFIMQKYNAAMSGKGGSGSNGGSSAASDGATRPGVVVLWAMAVVAPLIVVVL